MKNDSAYRKSNAVTTTNFCATDEVKQITSMLLQKDDAVAREEIGAQLLSHLARFFALTPPSLVVQDKPQSHTKRNGKLYQKTFGTYNAGTIRITNRTAIRGKIVASKTFLDTLIHEFVHHYDFYLLKLTRSVHTTGFFMRLNEIKGEILPDSPGR